MSIAATAVPYEVLSMIFLLCPEGGDTHRDRLFLLAVTAVCARWRAAALDTPRLWNQIRWNSYRDGFPHELPESNPMRFLAYLERSKPVALEMEFNIWDIAHFRLMDGDGGKAPFSFEVSGTAYDRVWREFCEGHADRCRSLILYVRTPESFALPLPAHRFKRLEVLDLNLESDDPLFDASSPPSLRKLTLHGDYLPIRSLSFIRTDLLESLQIAPDVGYVLDAYEFIAQCTRLLELDIDCGTTWPDEDAPKWNLPLLTHLRVQSMWPSVLHELVTAPNVVSLRFEPIFPPLSDWRPVDEWDATYEDGMMRIGGGRLRELELSGRQDSGECQGLDLPYVRLMLEKNPVIRSLRFQSWPRAWSVLWYLLDHPDPKLLSEHVFLKLLPHDGHDGAGAHEDGNEEGGDRSDSVSVPIPTVASAGYRIGMSSHSALLPDLEHLVLDECLLGRLHLVFDDVVRLVRAVLLARPHLRIWAQDGDATGTGATSLVEEFGERVKLGSGRRKASLYERLGLHLGEALNTPCSDP